MRVSQRVREHLRFLELNGRLTPDRVVEDAKRPDSPIHKYFTWDINKAAEQYWLDQARELIRTVKVVVTYNDITIHAPFYVPDPTKGPKEQGYTSIETLRLDPVSAKQSLLAEAERAASILRRARMIAASLEMEGEIDLLLASFAGLKNRLDNGEEVPPQ